MIKIEYNNGNEKYNVEVDDEEVRLSEVMYYFVKACRIAGYSIESFHNLVNEASEEIDNRYNLQDYLFDSMLMNE